MKTFPPRAITILLLAGFCGCTTPYTADKTPTNGLANVKSPYAPDLDQDKSFVEQSVDRVKAAFASLGPAEDKQQPANGPKEYFDRISLAQQPQETPDLIVAMAQLHERSGNAKGAAEQYHRALTADPNCLEALLGLSRMHDRQGEFQQANRFYALAAERHPQHAKVRNDWGLCLLRQGQPQGALRQLNKAVEFDPKKTLYRNNLSTLLVQTGRTDDALRQLSAVHPPAVAHYNLGFLLRQNNQPEAARRHFALAAQADPKFATAGQWADPTPAAQAASQPGGDARR